MKNQPRETSTLSPVPKGCLRPNPERGRGWSNLSDVTQQIPTTFKKDGINRILISRSAYAAIYELFINDDQPLNTWETVRVRHVRNDYKFPSGTAVSIGDEFLPSNSEWGKHGWTHLSLEKAQSNFKQINEDAETSNSLGPYGK